METMHVFEKAGLGKAPFRLVNVYTKRGPIQLGNGLSVGAPNQPMGSCDYCGTGIAECFEILSADGKRFVVGCDCVRKTGDAGLTKIVDKKVKELKDAATDKRIAAAFEKWESNPDLRDSFGDENAFGTQASYINFCFKNAGRSGKLKVARMIEKAIADHNAAIDA